MKRFFENVDKSSCQNCDSHVSDNFRRIFGDEDHLAQRCPACDSRFRIQKGSAAGADVDWPDPADQPERNRGPRVDRQVAADGGVVDAE